MGQQINYVAKKARLHGLLKRIPLSGSKYFGCKKLNVQINSNINYI